MGKATERKKMKTSLFIFSTVSAKECLSKVNGRNEYFGDQLSVTKSGRKCRNWYEIDPPLYELGSTVEQIAKHENFCRNPELVSKTMTETESNPWCFVHFETVEEMFEAIEKSRATNDDSLLFEDCDVSSLDPCNDQPINTDCDEEEKKYRGTENKTARGHACKCWNDVSLSNRPSDDDPTDEDILAVGKTWDYCNVIESCPDNEMESSGADPV